MPSRTSPNLGIDVTIVHRAASPILCRGGSGGQDAVPAPPPGSFPPRARLNPPRTAIFCVLRWICQYSGFDASDPHAVVNSRRSTLSLVSKAENLTSPDFAVSRGLEIVLTFASSAKVVYRGLSASVS